MPIISANLHGESDPAPASDHRDPQQNGQCSGELCLTRQRLLVLPLRQIPGADGVKDRHVQSGHADDKNLGYEEAVRQIFGGVGNEQQEPRRDRDRKRAPRERQDSAGNAAHRPANGGKPKQSQIGSILVVDLRLLGLASVSRPVSRVTSGILPLTWSAFAVAVASGFLLFISNATKYLANGFFVAKILLICVAGLNMAIFHVISARDLPKWENEKTLPRQAQLAGALSILLWVSVVTCGRWIGFTMEVR